MTPGSDCPTGKEQFASRDTAKDRAAAMNGRGKRVRAYRCIMCGCFHVAHRSRARKKRELLGR